MRLSQACLILTFAIAGNAALADTNSANQSGAAADMSQGEYLARLGNCAACHTIDGGEPFAGGLKMAVPMLGAIYTTNITPDPETGIGNYSFEDFDRSMRLGIAKDGHRLYPAMPYPSYAKITEEDMRAMYDFFMNEVKPVKQANRANEIPGWMSMRWPLAVWNFFTLDDNRYQPDESKSEQWNRGAYLTQGLGHCGACHTPRGLLFQEKALDESGEDFLAGAALDHWSASPLTGDNNVGLGRWSEDEVVQFLKTGKNRWGSAFGTMVEVINNSTQYMSDEDLRAMAVYLKSLPVVHEQDTPNWEYDDSSATQLAAFDFSAQGSQLYYEYCVSCHLYDGSGHNNYMPPLAGNPVVMDPNPSSLINLTLNGSLRVVVGGEPETYDMPYFHGLLDDQQIADVVTFIRQAWGHKASAVTAEEVAEIRAATDPLNSDIVVLKMK